MPNVSMNKRTEFETSFRLSKSFKIHSLWISDYVGTVLTRLSLLNNKNVWLTSHTNWLSLYCIYLSYFKLWKKQSTCRFLYIPWFSNMYSILQFRSKHKIKILGFFWYISVYSYYCSYLWKQTIVQLIHLIITQKFRIPR